MNSLLKGLLNIMKGCLLAVTLVVSTITVFWSDGMQYWNDMAILVWLLSIVILIELMDKKS